MKRSHKFEIEQGGIYWMVWSGERGDEIMQLYYNLKKIEKLKIIATC